MKSIYKKYVFIPVILLILVMAFPSLASAQFESFPDGGNPDAPIDGGLSLLVAAGVGYGAKKIKERKASTNNLKK